MVSSRPKSAATRMMRDVVAEHLLAPDPGEHDRPGVDLVQAAIRGKPLPLLHDLVQSHRTDHGGVPDGLQLRVPAVVGALELDDHEPATGVDPKQVNPAASTDEVLELLPDEQHIRRDDVDLVPQESLEVVSLTNLGRGVGRLRHGLEPVLGHLVDRHGKSLA